MNLEYAPASLFAAGAGISYQSVTAYPQLEGQNLPVPVRIDVLTLPFYANYYPLESTRHRPYVTGGMTLVSIQAQTDDVGVHASVGDQEANLLIRGMDLGSATLPLINLGGGYEYAHASGFLMRAQALIFYVGHVQPTLGLSVGYRF